MGTRRRLLILLAITTAVAVPTLLGGASAPTSTLAEREAGPDILVGAPRPTPERRATASEAPERARTAAPGSGDIAVGDLIPRIPRDDAGDPSTWVANVDVLGTSDEEPFPEPPSDGKCPNATSCDTNSIRHQKWKTAKDGTLEIGWRFNDEGRRNLRAPAGLLEGSVRRSMAEWSRWNSNIVFTYAGATTATFGASGKDGSCADGTNTVTWHRFDPSVIAAVVTCIDPKTNTVRDADLALNVTQHWETISGEPESRHTFDIDSIVTHEIGHWLSLLDLYDSRSTRQTMMGNAEYGETRKRTLALGDIIGLQTAYPCDDGDRCPRKGVVND